MLIYIGKRVLVAIPTLLIISLFVFALQKLLPGDPVLAMAGEDRNPETLAFLREKYRLNDPVIVQYFHWLGNALRGDLGVSLRTNQPVTELILQKLPVTLQLAVMSMIFAFLVYFGYANLVGFAVALMRRGELNPDMGTWYVHAVFLVLGIYVFRRKVANRPLLPRPTRRLARLARGS